jgi:hypothetical protein
VAQASVEAVDVGEAGSNARVQLAINSVAFKEDSTGKKTGAIYTATGADNTKFCRFDNKIRSLCKVQLYIGNEKIVSDTVNFASEK